MSFRTISAILLVLVLTSCESSPAPSADDAIGDWEKQDNLLPPINFVLSGNNGRIDARLRLSGVEANGTATLVDGQLRLRFPDRQDVVGQLISKNEMRLRLNGAGPEFVLRKRN
jgi:hypothetical protein